MFLSYIKSNIWKIILMFFIIWSISFSAFLYFVAVKADKMSLQLAQSFTESRIGSLK